MCVCVVCVCAFIFKTSRLLASDPLEETHTQSIMFFTASLLLVGVALLFGGDQTRAIPTNSVQPEQIHLSFGRKYRDVGDEEMHMQLTNATIHRGTR